MTVITNRHDRMAHRRNLPTVCTMCGDKPSFPYVLWEGDTFILICGKCSTANQRGLAADMIQVAASFALQKICSDRPVLVRTTMRELEAKELEQLRLEAAALLPR
jgi:hypothetical protein